MFLVFFSYNIFTQKFSCSCVPWGVLESGGKLTERGLSCVDIAFLPWLATFAATGTKKPGVHWSESLGAKCTVDVLRYIYYNS